MSRRTILALAAALVFSVASLAQAADKEQGVYIKVAEGMKADIGQTTGKVKDALKAGGFEVLADYTNGVPEGCSFKAATVVFTKSDYAAKMAAAGPDKAFGLPLRVGIYEDEKGLNIAVVNTVSLNRTFFAGNVQDAASQAVMDEVKNALKAAAATTSKHIGEIRTTGEIGGIGGGKFADKMIQVATSDKSVDEVAAAIDKGAANKSGWHSVYMYKPSADVAIVGLTNTAKTEGRAFDIAGDSRSGKNYKFPGLDHAAAFPIEVLVYAKAGKTGVFITNEMWRMKLYFADAGMWAFTKNMGMPGQIQDEIVAAVTAALK